MIEYRMNRLQFQQLYLLKNDVTKIPFHILTTRQQQSKTPFRHPHINNKVQMREDELIKHLRSAQKLMF